MGCRLLLRPAAACGRRARPRPAVLAGQPVLGLDGGGSQRRGPRVRPCLGRVEPARPHPLPGPRAAVRRRVRLAGAAHLGDAARRDHRRSAHARVARHGPPPEGAGRQRQARPRPRPPLRRADRRRRLAVGHPAQPGPGRPQRRRALPIPTGDVHGHDLVAAQRLVAGHQLGARGRRRPAEAGVARAAGRVRAPPADDPTAGFRARSVRRQRLGGALAGRRHGPPSRRRRTRARRGGARPRRGAVVERDGGGARAGLHTRFARARARARRGGEYSGVVVVRRRPGLRLPPAHLRCPPGARRRGAISATRVRERRKVSPGVNSCQNATPDHAGRRPAGA